LITEARDFGELVIRQRLPVNAICLLSWTDCRTLLKPNGLLPSWLRLKIGFSTT
jgi:hypothetical protein